jgi:hypothetical protein
VDDFLKGSELCKQVGVCHCGAGQATWESRDLGTLPTTLGSTGRGRDTDGLHHHTRGCGLM